MGLFFKISQAIQTEFNQKLRKTEAPEEYLNEFITDLVRQKMKLQDKHKATLERKKSGENKKGEDLELHIDNLLKDMNELEQKIETAKSRYNFYMARQKRMEVHKNIRDAMAEVDDLSRYDMVRGDM